MFRKVTMTMVAALVLGVVAGQAAAAPILIDDFTSSGTSGAGNPGARVIGGLINDPGANQLAGSNVIAGFQNVLGERTFTLTGTTAINGIGAALVVTGSEKLSFSTDAGISSVGTVDYSGSIDLTGLTSFLFDASDFSPGSVGSQLPFTILLFDGANLAAGVFNIAGNGTDIEVPIIAPPGFNFSAIQSLTISFDASGASAAGTDVSIDNLRAVTNVPEPSTLVCFGIGLACVAGVRALRRNRRVAA